MKIIREVNLNDIYFIALQHPSRESYVDEAGIVDISFKGRSIKLGKDSKHRRNLDSLLFLSQEDAIAFADNNLNSSCKKIIRKMGNENVNRIKSLNEYYTESCGIGYYVYKANY